MRKWVAAAIVAAMVASAATGLVAAWMGGRRHDTAPQEIEIARLRALLDETRAELATLRSAPLERESATAPAAVPAGGKPGPPSRTPAPAPPPRAATLPEGGDAAEEALEELEGGVEEYVPAPVSAAEVREAEARAYAARRPQPHVQGLLDARQWERSVEARQRWILRPEGDLLSLCGKPDEVWVMEGGGETWRYLVLTGLRDEKGEEEWIQLHFFLNRGRVTGVSE